LKDHGVNNLSKDFREPEKEHTMIKWILILLAVAAIAALLGFGSISGAALTGAKILIGIVLILFVLVLFGVIAIFD
tara:strand:+ start:928 stop:1155 length:228 start_codon:yes stop_codon:yes gene_type:complete